MSIQVDIENFKCFERVSISLGSLTILTGYNGAGKSTVLQSLLLLGQSLRSSPDRTVVPLNGSLVSLGSGLDVTRDPNRPIRFRVSGPLGARAEWDLRAERRIRHLKVDRFDGTLAEGDDGDDLGLISLLRDVTYISATRLFMTQAWPSPPTDTPFGDVGSSGEFAPYWHFHQGDDPVPMERQSPGDERTTVRGQVDAYMGDLFPGAQANTDQLKDVDLYRLEFLLGTSGWVRPSNIGYGLSYVFPILVTLINARKGSVVVIDSPEAHLHPRAQSHLGRIVSRFAAAGVRVIVETHSDHFLNGVRLAVREKIVGSADVQIYFFSGAASSDHGVKALSIDPTGEIDFWPKGFFDQAERDFSKLVGIEL